MLTPARKHAPSPERSRNRHSSPAHWPRFAASAARVAIALLVFTALLSNLFDALAEGTLAQNLSYFTNQSNAAFAVLLVAIGVLGPRRRPSWDDVRGAVTFYLVMTGLIYALWVAPLAELGRWDIGWTGIVLHRIAPIAALIDWMATPRRRSPARVRVLWWLVYPLGYLAFTWIRGAVTSWYPYDFLDPTIGGWPPVLRTTLIVLCVFLLFAALVHSIAGCLRRRV